MPDISSLGPSAAVVIVVFIFIKFLTGTGTKLVESLDRVAKATEISANEAKERNGHLAELTISSTSQMMEALKKINDVSVANAIGNRDILATLKSSAVILKEDTANVADNVKIVKTDLEHSNL